MKKSNLKNFMIVELRDGKRFVVVDDALIHYAYYDLLSSYANNLKNLSGSEYDIIRVYEHYNHVANTNFSSLECMLDAEKYYTLLWERKELPKLNEYEEDMLTVLYDAGFMYIARDEDGKLYAYKEAPIVKFSTDTNWRGGYAYNRIPTKKLFTFVKWGDYEPYSIKELLDND